MTFVNEGDVDRALRMLAGIMLLYASLGGFVSGTAGILMMIVGALAIVTGVIGYCPAYTLFGVSTRRA